MAVILKYLNNLWRTLGMLLINCETNLRSDKCVLSNDTKATTFGIMDIKLHVPTVTLSCPDNVKLLQKLKSDFKRITNWKKHVNQK